jgi:hypothetical protein
MPTKRLIPLHILPLDVELTLSHHALYSSSATGSRKYIISRMELFSHILTFHSDVPRSIDEVVATQGIYFHLSTFYKAATTVIGTTSLPGVAQINLNFNAINSVHFVFMYNTYGNNPAARKLHFVSHNLSKLQVQNGTF